MFRNALVAAVAALLFTTPALAQLADSSSGSRSTGVGISGAQSGAVAAPNQEIIFNSRNPDSLDTTASAIPPDLTAGTNPCVGSTSLGGGITGFNLSGGTTWTDPGCERRALSALMYSYGLEEASVLILACGDQQVRNALELTGTEVNCAGDANEAPASGAMVTATNAGGTWDDEYCETYKPASLGGTYASAPAGWADRCQ